MSAQTNTLQTSCIQHSVFLQYFASFIFSLMWTSPQNDCFRPIAHSQTFDINLRQLRHPTFTCRQIKPLFSAQDKDLVTRRASGLKLIYSLNQLNQRCELLQKIPDKRDAGHWSGPGKPRHRWRAGGFFEKRRRSRFSPRMMAWSTTPPSPTLAWCLGATVPQYPGQLLSASPDLRLQSQR